jgi:hypothetical protein
MYQCPGCKATNSVRTSESRLWEQPLRLLGLHPFRCQACSERFHRRWKISPESLGHGAIARTDVSIPHAPITVLPRSIPVLPRPVAAIGSYPSLKVDIPASGSAFLTAHAPAREISDAEEATRPRNRSSSVWPYTFKSFAVLLLLHFLVGGLEFAPLGRAAMWVNLLSLVTLSGALMVFIDLYRGGRDYSEAAGSAAALVLRWEALFLALELVFGFLLGPGGPGVSSLIALFREQAPWIWMTYAVLPMAGALGCSAYLLYCNRREA